MGRDHSLTFFSNACFLAMLNKVWLHNVTALLSIHVRAHHHMVGTLPLQSYLSHTLRAPSLLGILQPQLSHSLHMLAPGTCYLRFTSWRGNLSMSTLAVHIGPVLHVYDFTNAEINVNAFLVVSSLTDTYEILWLCLSCTVYTVYRIYTTHILFLPSPKN